MNEMEKNVLELNLDLLPLPAMNCDDETNFMARKVEYVIGVWMILSVCQLVSNPLLTVYQSCTAKK